MGADSKSVEHHDGVDSITPGTLPLSDVDSTELNERWFHATVAYDGTRYGGWQIQPNSVTIQQRLEEALATVAGYRVQVVGSGRTDAGVHAQGQVASFKLHHWRAAAECLIPAINRRLPVDIVVQKCCDMKPHFHAQRHALSKWYRYTVRMSRVADPIQRRFHWHVSRPLDLAKMSDAAKLLVGELDFAGFQALGAPRKSTVRHVYRLDLSTIQSSRGVDLWIDIEANGFLYNMVRNITGTLVEIGFGRFPADHVCEMLASRNRSKGGQTAPARGLCLMSVHYPSQLFLSGDSGNLPSMPLGEGAHE